MTYTVRVTREGTTWLAEVPGLPGAHTHARTLRTLDHRVREVVALVEELPAGAEDGLALRWDYSAVAPPETDAGTARVREQGADATRDLVTRLVHEGWTRRDIATVLHLTPQRVSRLASGTTRAA